MANKNYRAGRAFEYRVAKTYRDLGYTVLRTAGSHGPFDLIAIPHRWRAVWPVTLFIQCKNRPPTQAERDKLSAFDEVHDMPAYACARMVWKAKGSSEILHEDF